MKFKSKKDTLFSLVILGTCGLMLVLTVTGILKGEMDPDEYWTLPIVIGVCLALLWFYFGTYYELGKEGLTYRSGPIRGKIRLDRITEIVKGKTLWVGFRPATSRKGLIVKYDTYNEIYISPLTNESFVKKILELKSDIKISE
ncbi:PH domain-containing protein [Maribacter sp. MMG018]|uniref:PH domain-containing protein n=1 Tax=Maribacter sp. MMG018 TaxID=2822688 RepID=UPI001B399186|nr:PH domain-containing protein [Maribacter sp. MMG018]